MFRYPTSRDRFVGSCCCLLAKTFCITLLLSAGCSKTNDDVSIDNPADLNAPDPGLTAAQSIAPSMDNAGDYSPTATNTPERPISADRTTIQSGSNNNLIPGDSLDASGIVGQEETPYTTPLTLAQPSDMTDRALETAEDTANQLQLRPDLTSSELVDFLSQTDQYMQLLMSGRGITDPEDAFAEMNRVAKVKLEAARRLVNLENADAKQVSEGARGELQALSHLAAQGDVNSAQELRSLAKKNLRSPDTQLAADSRIVLIGFAIESLQSGEKGAADEIVSLIDSIDSSISQPDVPALMMMGHARSLLTQYEFDQQAIKVRQRILDLFASSPNPEIAKMAAQAAGNVKFDNVEKLRKSVLAGKEVPGDQWVASVTRLIDDAPDLVTVQYLAGTALEFEASSKQQLALETYRLMEQRFDDPKSATGREVELALEARAARERVIGNTYAPNLPTTSGAKMPLSDFEGKVILMPFWATGFKESLQIIPMLKEITEQHPNQVVIVGMNLDPADVPVDEFEPEKQLGFRSYRSVSSVEAEGGNPVASQFGMVSMPFVVILDQQQQIVALDFTGRKLQPTVAQLLE